MIFIRKILLSIFLLAAFISCKTSHSALKEQPGIVENALLWEIQGNNLNEKSYLFGTMHLIDSNSFYWPNRTLDVFNEVKEITFEVDMSMMDDVSKQMSLMSKAIMKGNVSLSDLLTKKDYDIVDKHFSKMGLPLFFLEKIKPMFLTVFASNSSENVSYELKLLSLAKEQNKSISGLETMEYQLSIFDSIPYKEQAQSLVESIEMESNENNAMDEMIQLYRNQNINRLYKIINNEMKDSKGQQFLMLDNRNQNWIPVMDKMMTNSSHFFAVGAGHLAGPNGLISLLRKKSYKLTPISNH